MGNKFTQMRRWAMRDKRKDGRQIAEGDITPDEARMAVHSMMIELGHQVYDLQEYDRRADVFRLLTRSDTGKLLEVKIAGERVAQVVHLTRILGGNGNKKLPRHFGQGQPKQDIAL